MEQRRYHDNMPPEYRPIASIETWVFHDDGERDAVMELPYLSDRAAAIVAATLLDNHVTNVLKEELKHGDDKVLGELLRGRGPIGAFANRIRVIYALGLITKQGYEDLRAINRIRNLFAHNSSVRTFDHEQVKSLCMSLKVIDSLVMEADSQIREGQPSPLFTLPGASEELRNVRSRYFIAIGAYSMALHTVRLFEPQSPY